MRRDGVGGDAGQRHRLADRRAGLRARCRRDDCSTKLARGWNCWIGRTANARRWPATSNTPAAHAGRADVDAEKDLMLAHGPLARQENTAPDRHCVAVAAAPTSGAPRDEACLSGGHPLTCYPVIVARLSLLRLNDPHDQIHAHPCNASDAPARPTFRPGLRADHPFCRGRNGRPCATRRPRPALSRRGLFVVHAVRHHRRRRVARDARARGDARRGRRRRIRHVAAGAGRHRGVLASRTPLRRPTSCSTPAGAASLLAPPFYFKAPATKGSTAGSRRFWSAADRRAR